jgi:uncharacterized protein (DUF4415 family)
MVDAFVPIPTGWPLALRIGYCIYNNQCASPSTQYSACERQTIVKKSISRRTLKSDLARVDAHSIRAHEYKELPELTAQALSRAAVNKGGRPRSANPRKLISIRLPVDVIERWKATGPGWQTRIAERLSKRR